MSYQVLARKWRPRNFSQVVGQEAVVRALRNALERGRLHHAYLFTGTRGVGKTSLARILARCFNCEGGVTAEPCGECANCRDVDAGCFPDLLEVDAASRTRVEDTRALLDKVVYAPSRGRFRVYLIDEVHMLSDHSFNALLKTLEEPPGHVRFLLATTEPRKLPATVLSRCLQFHLRHLRPAEIIGQLARVLAAEEEPVAAEPAALEALARAADGSMRDALSLCDQAIAHGGGRLEAAPLRELLGTVGQDRVPALLEALTVADGPALLGEVEQLAAFCPDYRGLLVELLACLHRIALEQAVPGSGDERLADWARRLDPETVQLFYQAGVVGRRDFELAPNPRSALEMSLLRMLSFRLAPAVVADAPSATGPAAQLAGGGGAGTRATPGRAALSGQPQSAAAEPAGVGGAGTQAEPPGAAQSKPPAAAAEPGAAQNSPQTASRAASPTPQPASRAASPTPQPASRATAPPTADGAADIAPQPASPPPAPAPAAEAAGELGVAGDWPALCGQLGLSGRLATVAGHCALRAEDCGERAWRLLIAEEHSALLAKEHAGQLAQAVNSHLGTALQVRIERAAPGAVLPPTPAQRKARLQQAELREAAQRLAADPGVLELQRRFGAELLPESVRAVAPSSP